MQECCQGCGGLREELWRLTLQMVTQSLRCLRWHRAVLLLEPQMDLMREPLHSFVWIVTLAKAGRYLVLAIITQNYLQ